MSVLTVAAGSVGAAVHSCAKQCEFVQILNFWWHFFKSFPQEIETVTTQLCDEAFQTWIRNESLVRISSSEIDDTSVHVFSKGHQKANAPSEAFSSGSQCQNITDWTATQATSSPSKSDPIQCFFTKVVRHVSSTGEAYSGDHINAICRRNSFSRFHRVFCTKKLWERKQQAFSGRLLASTFCCQDQEPAWKHDQDYGSQDECNSRACDWTISDGILQRG